MKMIVGVALLLLGGWLIYTGYNRAQSLLGKAEKGIAELGNEIDGKSRVPDHVWYYAGGAALILGGGWVATRKR